MEFFDKLTKKASETYKGAAEKTGKIAKEAKLKMKISDNKSKINSLYQEIGKKVYQKHTANENLNIKEDLEEECSKIDAYVAEIEEYHKEILDLSDMKICIKCGEHMEKQAKFCPKCGTEQPQEEVKEVEVIEQDEHCDKEDKKEECCKEENKECENKKDDCKEENKECENKKEDCKKDDKKGEGQE